MNNNTIQKSKITDDMLIRYIPVSTVTVGSIQAYRGECVLTKEEFLLAYNTWVKENKNENEQT